MSTPVEPNPAEPQEPSGQEPQEPTSDPGAADQGTETGGNEMSLEDALSALKAARNEAAKHRVNAKELKDQLAAAKSPEDFQAVSDRAAQLEVELSNARLAVKYSLPENLASRIQGDTEEAREKDAQSLAALFAKPESLGSGGLNPAEKETKADPRTLASRVPRSRR